MQRISNDDNLTLTQIKFREKMAPLAMVSLLIFSVLSSPLLAQGNPTPKQPATQQTPAGKATSSKENDTPLPSDYQVPARVAEIMTIDKPLITEQQLLELKREVIKNKASKIILNGLMSDSDKKVIKRWVQYQLYPMTMKKNRTILPRLRRQLGQQISNGARRVTNADQAKIFRTYFLQEIADGCEKLLDNNFQVRVTAILILTHLDVVEQTPGKPPAIPFMGSYKTFLKVLKDPKQHIALKILSANGLERILLGTRPNGNIKQEIARVLISELEKPNNHYWYEMRLIQALARVDMPKWLGLNGLFQPFCIRALQKIINDKQRHWVVRSEAVRSLGLTKLDLSEKEMAPTKLAADAVRFCNEMSESYNKNPKHTYWNEAFFKTLLAFRPNTISGLKRKDGLRTQFPNIVEVNQAHDLIKDVFLHVKQQTGAQKNPIPNAEMQKLSEWLKQSPGNSSVPSTALPGTVKPALKTASNK